MTQTIFLLGYDSIVKLLIENGADVNIKDSGGWFPIFYASSTGKRINFPLEICFLKWCYLKNRKISLIHLGQLSVLELLIQNGADLNVRNKHGQTALHISTKYYLKKVVELLIQNGANPNLKQTEGYAPIHDAASYPIGSNGADILNILIEYGADINIQSNRGQTPLLITTYNVGMAFELYSMIHPVSVVAKTMYLNDLT